ncbi:hypothetical protein [Carnobacterium maltaromaticum]|uniref:hypothetical protein n=1 Tax=Carnobacterium maltaromaticum TaxID=2751 RepID=UPI00295EEDFB|nr:hypothetical protein [Carnobacterium maltaromaticum]
MVSISKKKKLAVMTLFIGIGIAVFAAPSTGNASQLIADYNFEFDDAGWGSSSELYKYKLEVTPILPESDYSLAFNKNNYVLLDKGNLFYDTELPAGSYTLSLKNMQTTDSSKLESYIQYNSGEIIRAPKPNGSTFSFSILRPAKIGITYRGAMNTNLVKFNGYTLMSH